ncbi:hypothetical protein [Herbaspirillum sp.]|jgi:hypothetical protein|uniref:hypothetical protein n=1 Tax=Herbaspirillum sp. TaxID=1890675 RepID=UPI000C0A0226|nr:hypothetical protein [Herbaspirillum sp.]MAF06198.1 hypothetical protein [Herbaspirillum sp.]|tara:strand:+ start:11566 stop:11781 length:216 start_codon:yes stop_codon:yes gene_type:complete
MGIAYLAFMAATFYMGYKRMYRKMMASDEADARCMSMPASIFAGMIFSLICITALGAVITIFKTLYMIVAF